MTLRRRNMRGKANGSQMDNVSWFVLVFSYGKHNYFASTFFFTNEVYV